MLCIQLTYDMYLNKFSYKQLYPVNYDNYTGLLDVQMENRWTGKYTDYKDIKQVQQKLLT